MRVEAEAPRHLPPTLPDEPLVTIEPSKSFVALNLRDLWLYRELLYFMTWRDVKVRYKQTVLGAAWAILQPVLMMIIFTLFFGGLVAPSTGGVPYPVFVYAGLVLWTFFATAVTGSGNSLVGNANLVTKVYFPRMMVPAAAVGAGLVDLLLSFLVLLGMMFYYRLPLTTHALMLPVLVLMTTLFALGVGMWLSALNVKYRDIRFALPFLIQIWLFVSSVIIPSKAIPQKFQKLLVLNPMSGLIEAFRSALFGFPFDWAALSFSAVVICATLVFSAYAFKRMEKQFADVI